jgi:hypothetical protein
VEIGGLRGGPGRGWLTIILEGEEIRCRANQSFEEIFEDRDIETQGQELWLQDGRRVNIKDKIGESLQQSPATEVEWVQGIGRWRNGLEQTCATPVSVPGTAAGLFSPAAQAFEPQFAGNGPTAVRSARV